jgi:hypothetical protein
MTPRSFVYLAIAAVLIAVLAVVSYASHNQWSTGEAAGEKLLPALASQASQLATIEIRKGDGTVILKRSGGAWSLGNRSGYPVDPAKVRTLLVGLAEADLIEAKTRKPERYAALQLEDPAGKDAKSRLVRLLGENGNVIGEVVIGKKRFDMLGTGKNGTYVRRPGDAQTWLADAELEASVAVKDWVKASIFTADAAKISRIAIDIPGEESLRIERKAATPANDEAAAKDGAAGKTEGSAKSGKEAEAGKLQFVGFPEADKKLKDAGAAENVGRAVASIDMEDVRKLDASSPDAGVSTVGIEMANGLVTTMRLRKEGEAHWLSVIATGEGEAKKAADEINQRLQGWEFKIPSYKADTILKKRADLLEASS